MDSIQNFYCLKDMQKISFRCDADAKIGFGHLSRCLTLAYEAERWGLNPVFLLRSQDTAAKSLVEDNHFEIKLDARVEEWPKCPVVLDLAHTKILERPQTIDRLFRKIKNAGLKCAWIDSMGEHSAHKNFNERTDLIITPYLGAENDVRPKCERWLSGAKYAILNPNLKNSLKLETKFERRLLLTLGGSDPWLLTEEIMSVVSQLDASSWTFRVVIGPLFEKGRTQRIKSAHPRWEIAENRTNLVADYSECDAVVCASGLTRYEVAALQLPCLLISPTKLYFDYLLEFKKRGIADVLFKTDSNFREQLSISVENLLSHSARKPASALVDLEGCARVMKVLKEMCDEI